MATKHLKIDVPHKPGNGHGWETPQGHGCTKHGWYTWKWPRPTDRHNDGYRVVGLEARSGDGLSHVIDNFHIGGSPNLIKEPLKVPACGTAVYAELVAHPVLITPNSFFVHVRDLVHHGSVGVEAIVGEMPKWTSCP